MVTINQFIKCPGMPVVVLSGPHKNLRGHLTWMDESGSCRVTPVIGSALNSIEFRSHELAPLNCEK